MDFLDFVVISAIVFVIYKLITEIIIPYKFIIVAFILAVSSLIGFLNAFSNYIVSAIECISKKKQ